LFTANTAEPVIPVAATNAAVSESNIVCVILDIGKLPNDANPISLFPKNIGILIYF
jgi:hypothetical protein